MKGLTIEEIPREQWVAYQWHDITTIETRRQYQQGRERPPGQHDRAGHEYDAAIEALKNCPIEESNPTT